MFEFCVDLKSLEGFVWWFCYLINGKYMVFYFSFIMVLLFLLFIVLFIMVFGFVGVLVCCL